jgi:hypothetical protein
MIHPATGFVAVYWGSTIGTAKLVAVSADPAIVEDFATRLLSAPPPTADPVMTAIERGRRGALRIVKRGATDAAR